MYRYKAVAICFVLLAQADCRAFSRAWANTGKRIAARMAIIAITTSSSIRVKPPVRRIRFLLYSSAAPQACESGQTRSLPLAPVVHDSGLRGLSPFMGVFLSTDR